VVVDNEERKAIAEHMANFGGRILCMANMHAHQGNPGGSDWQEMAVVEAAHAAEIFVKACIAAEHPLLIFENVPYKSRPVSMDDLLEGQTVKFNDLPILLMQSTGHKIDVHRFREFGKLRNRIQHFLPPAGMDLGGEALRFVFEVLDPFIHSAFGWYAIDFNDDYEYDLLIDALAQREILFQVSEGAAEAWFTVNFYTAGCSNAYLRKMNKRVIKAGGKPYPLAPEGSDKPLDGAVITATPPLVIPSTRNGHSKKS
jgi:hypothetical protein